jgi:hypothetical protein
MSRWGRTAMDFKVELRELIERDPFLPFRIKLVNGDAHDIGYPRSIALLSDSVYVAPLDGHCAQFP